MYEGIMKQDPLSKFFDSVLDGTADLKAANKEAAKDSESYVQDDTEAEIERKQEAEMLKLAHGGYAEFIDFEQAIKDGHGKNFHEVHGYAGAMGGAPKKKPAASSGSASGDEKGASHPETAVANEDSSNLEEEAGSEMPVTGEAEQVVMAAPKTEDEQPKTVKRDEL